MALFTDSERGTIETLLRLGYCNPFLPERIEYERVVLGRDFVETDGTWHKRVEEEADRPNIELLTQRSKVLADGARERLAKGERPGDAERDLYQDTVLYYLFNEYVLPFYEYVNGAEKGKGLQNAIPEIYDRFREDIAHYFGVSGVSFTQAETDHMFACFFQLRRAWYYTYHNIIGGSPASARLRAAVWQSIFTCDMRRYRRALFNRMGDVTTLVTGPSGTGKELVARAIGMSRYIPFNSKTKQFATDFTQCFYPINLSALSPTLIESELFGHAKGAFTGAIGDRVGFFELCPADGAVFLDEIGEMDPAIQVKLLRVLQSREFQRVGDAAERVFEGKVIAATNRDLAQQMQEGRFRKDLYYRICSDIIVTPPLREQIQGYPEQLHNLLLFITRRMVGNHEAEVLAAEVAQWIESNLPADYPWPGNVRELEQCVRNVMIRNEYRPPKTATTGPVDAYLEKVRSGALTAEEAFSGYCTIVYAQTGNYVESARRLGLDRRTVKDRVDGEFLAKLRGV